MSHPVRYWDGSEVLDPPKIETDKWLVNLPHQCDNWDIAGYDSDGVSQERAIEALESFVADAQRALEALRKGEEYGAGDDD